MNNLSLKSYDIYGNEYQFDIKDYKIIRNIGSGNLSTINLVQNIKNNNFFIAKTSCISNIKQNKLLFYREIRILFQIHHQTLISYRGISFHDFSAKENITFLIDYMEEGSLAKLIDEEQKTPNFDNTKKQIILAGVARGMMILHDHHIIQKYLKPENILLDSEYHPHISDFGISKIFDPSNTMIHLPSNYVYMAPEIISNGDFTTKSDVYAFGIIMYEIILGKRVSKVSEDQPIKIKSYQMKENFQGMIEKCLSENPNDRPTFSDIFKKLSLSSSNFFYENKHDSNLNNDEEMNYCLDGVDLNKYLKYIDEIEKEIKTTNQEEIELKKQIHQMSNTINEQAEEIQLLKNELEMFKNLKDKIDNINFNSMIDDEFLRIIKNFVISSVSSSSPGILYILKMREKSSFRNKSFIVSSSQGDIFNLINPRTNDCFCSANWNNFFIEFILENPILIGGLDIYAANSHFPQSFDIDIDGKNVVRIKQTKQLNGPGKMMTVHFTPVNGRKVKIILTGPSLDQRDCFVLFKRIEIMTVTAIAERPKEYFASLVELSENKDPHKCPVYINATAFDFNSFFTLDTSKNIGINGQNSWFQIELTNGLAVLTGCRILRCKDPNKLKSYKIICTNDVENPMNSWTTLIEIDEKSKNEHEILGIFRFPIQSPPVKYIRIVLTGPNWSNQFFLSFFHFDLFGIYF